MRLKSLSVVLLMMCCVSAVAQKIDGHYVSRSEADGTIYFLLSQELFADEQGRTLKYDLTVKRSRSGEEDTVRMNFSYVNDTVKPVDSLWLSSQRVDIKGGVEKIYIEPSRKEWSHRYSFVGDLDDFMRLYDVGSPATLTLYSGGEAVVYRSKDGEWRRYSPIGLRIFEMIRLN